MLICAETSGIADGTSVKIKIVEKDDDGNDDDVATISGTVKSGKIECKWKVIYTADEDDSNSQKEKEEKGYTLPEYAFIVECDGIVSEESGKLDVMGWIRTQFKNKRTGEIMANRGYVIYLIDGSRINGKTDENGFVNLKNLKKGDYFIIFKEH